MARSILSTAVALGADMTREHLRAWYTTSRRMLHIHVSSPVAFWHSFCCSPVSFSFERSKSISSPSSFAMSGGPYFLIIWLIDFVVKSRRSWYPPNAVGSHSCVISSPNSLEIATRNFSSISLGPVSKMSSTMVPPITRSLFCASIPAMRKTARDHGHFLRPTLLSTSPSFLLNARAAGGSPGRPLSTLYTDSVPSSW